MINLICADAAGTGGVGNIIIWVVLIVALLFMLIFPTLTQKRRNKQYQEMINGIRVGDTVRTAGGVIGRVVRITNKGEITTVTLETGSKSEKSYTEFDMNFINCVLKSTRVEEAKEEKKEEKTDAVQENSSDVSDVAPENEPAKETKKAKADSKKTENNETDESVETTETEKKPRAKSAVKKTTKKSAKK